jgi:hypothetical protein
MAIVIVKERKKKIKSRWAFLPPPPPFLFSRHSTYTHNTHIFIYSMSRITIDAAAADIDFINSLMKSK